MPPPVTENGILISRHGKSESARLCYLVTHPMTTCLLRGQLRYMRACGYDVTLITSPGNELDSFKEAEGIDIRRVPMERVIHPIRDLRAIIRLYWVFRSMRPHIVNAGTPKAGLLAMLAARLARVPVRVYTVRGLRLETTRGLKRGILTVAERVASACAHRVICVGHSLADQYLKLGFADRQKTVVLGGGSSNGVDAWKFAPTTARIAQAQRVREQLGISPGEPVIGYVGRLARDKGIAHLVHAFRHVNAHVPAVRLVLVGDLDKADPLDEGTLSCIRSHPRIITTGFVDDAAPYYRTMNVFAFPSFREGFPNAVLEAQAAGLPVVGYQATGVVDAILDGVTGRLVPIGAVEQLADALLEYLHDPKLAAAHGASGQRRARSEFSNQRIWSALRQEYHDLLHSAGLAPDSRAAPPGMQAA